MELNGKVALVTGAARGIGRAVCVAFARAGADVCGLDICGRVSSIQTYRLPTSDDLVETGRHVKEAGRRWLAVHADIRDRAELERTRAELLAVFGKLDILACVAGIQAFAPLLEMEDADWDDPIDVNLTGTAKCLRVFAPTIIANGGGRVLLTSSTQGRHGMLNGSAYSASKWGLLGLMKSAALELGKHHVTVNAVIPGLINTELTRNKGRYQQALQEANGGEIPFGDLEENARKALIKKTPLKLPWIDPEAVAAAYVFLASDAAAMITGSAYDVTGGDSAHNV